VTELLRSEIAQALHGFERGDLDKEGLVSVLGDVESRMRGSHDPLHGQIRDLYNSIDEAADLDEDEERAAILAAVRRFWRP
jgi:hypothetical protein